MVDLSVLDSGKYGLRSNEQSENIIILQQNKKSTRSKVCTKQFWVKPGQSTRCRTVTKISSFQYCSQNMPSLKCRKTAMMISHSLWREFASISCRRSQSRTMTALWCHCAVRMIYGVFKLLNNKSCEYFKAF